MKVGVLVSIASTKIEFERNMVFRPGLFRLTKNKGVLTLFKLESNSSFSICVNKVQSKQAF